MKYEWDPDKNKKNRGKHEISFEKARTIFSDPRVLVLRAKTVDGEERSAAIGQIDGKIWIVFYVVRNSTVCIFSCRRARRSEVKAYE